MKTLLSFNYITTFTLKFSDELNISIYITIYFIFKKDIKQKLNIPLEFFTLSI